MRQDIGENVSAGELKKELGQAIKRIRSANGAGAISQRKLAEAVNIPPSNMKYIEDGVNAPSPRVYSAIVLYLQPGPAQRKELDRLYSAIRETPPPDVCRIMCANEGLNDVLRVVKENRLNQSQLNSIHRLPSSFYDGIGEAAQ